MNRKSRDCTELQQQAYGCWLLTLERSTPAPRRSQAAPSWQNFCCSLIGRFRTKPELPKLIPLMFSTISMLPKPLETLNELD